MPCLPAPRPAAGGSLNFAQPCALLFCRLSEGIIYRSLKAGGGHVGADHNNLGPEAGPHAAMDHTGTDLAPGW